MRIEAVNRAAEGTGVRPGMPLAAASAICPDLKIDPADPRADRAALERLADWCGRYAPWTAADNDGNGPGAAGLWLDATGSAHLQGGEAELLADVVRRLASFGFAARAAIADTPGAAWAVARFATGAGSFVVVPAGQTLSTLVALPVAGLRLPLLAVEGLSRMGLRRIGDLVGLPRGPLAARFGAILLTRLDQSLGRIDEPISPRFPPPPLHVRLAFAEPIGRREDIAAGLERLLVQMTASLEKSAQGARRLSFTLYRVDGSLVCVEIGTSRPSRDAGHLARLFREKFDGLDPGFGIEAMTVAALTLDPLTATQADLETPTAPEADLARLLDRLGNRLGETRIVRLVPTASHLPERASRAVAAATAAPIRAAPMAGPKPDTRPIRLLSWPEPIDVIAALPDEPPVAFRWRGAAHRIAHAEGPERIGPEWWLEEPTALASEADRARDYFRLADESGGRFWVFRNGLYRSGAVPRWYLHGVFA